MELYPTSQRLEVQQKYIQTQHAFIHTNQKKKKTFYIHTHTDIFAQDRGDITV